MILIAGASGAVGFECVRLARQWGAPIRTLSRSPQNSGRLREHAGEVITADAALPRGIDGICRGVHTVISCLGASVNPNAAEKRSFREVDTAANVALLDEASRSKVRRFIYVSLHLEPCYAHTAYVMAHEEVVKRVRESGLDFTIVRPTGIFSAFLSMLDIARKGMLPRIGDGSARTNPIDPADVAEVIGRYLEKGPADVSVGGPEIFTRRQIGELVFDVLGKKPRLLGVPAGMLRLSASAMGIWNRRMSELVEFLSEAATHDCVAPVAGQRRLEDYLRANVK